MWNIHSWLYTHGTHVPGVRVCVCVPCTPLFSRFQSVSAQQACKCTIHYIYPALRMKLSYDERRNECTGAPQYPCYACGVGGGTTIKAILHKIIQRFPGATALVKIRNNIDKNRKKHNDASDRLGTWAMLNLLLLRGAPFQQTEQTKRPEIGTDLVYNSIYSRSSPHHLGGKHITPFKRGEEFPKTVQGRQGSKHCCQERFPQKKSCKLQAAARHSLSPGESAMAIAKGHRLTPTKKQQQQPTSGGGIECSKSTRNLAQGNKRNTSRLHTDNTHPPVRARLPLKPTNIQTIAPYGACTISVYMRGRHRHSLRCSGQPSQKHEEIPTSEEKKTPISRASNTTPRQENEQASRKIDNAEQKRDPRARA